MDIGGAAFADDGSYAGFRCFLWEKWSTVSGIYPDRTTAFWFLFFCYEIRLKIGQQQCIYDKKGICAEIYLCTVLCIIEFCHILNLSDRFNLCGCHFEGKTNALYVRSGDSAFDFICFYDRVQSDFIDTKCIF